MFRKLLRQNPHLKLLLPLLLLVLLWVFYAKIFALRLAYHQQLKEEIAQLEQELGRIERLTKEFANLNQEEMERELQNLRENLGVGLYSPEIISILEKKAAESGVVLLSLVFMEPESQENNQKRAVNLGIWGDYVQLRAFLASLEDYPPYAGTKNLDILPRGTPPSVRPRRGPAYGVNLEAHLEVVFISVPNGQLPGSGSTLPAREHPFGG
jgi:Tfp pilus assembly protein PilO